METVLHLGCHRTGNATFHSYLQSHMSALRKGGLEIWGPERTQQGLFCGLVPNDPGAQGVKAHLRAAGRVRINFAKTMLNGASSLLISDPSLIGSMRENLKAGSLYPAIGTRMAHVANVFGAELTRIVLVFRAQDRYWASALRSALERGDPMPSAAQIEALASTPRRWRDVITDLACAVPHAEICVIPYEAFCADPETLMRTTCKLPSMPNSQPEWLNRSGATAGLRRKIAQTGAGLHVLPFDDTPWTPFSERQIAQMQEDFADDLFWLAAGAEGLAKLTKQAMPGGRGKAHRDGTMRGQANDQEGSLEQTG